MVAASLVFDHILDDLVVCDADRDRLAPPRYVDEHLPSRMRRHYDAPFLRKLLATAAKVAQDLASGEYTYPACTAEELVLWMVLQQWQLLLDRTDLGPSWTDLSDYLFEDLDFEYVFDADMDGIEDDPLAQDEQYRGRPLTEWFAPFNTDSRTHPYALNLNERDEPVLYDLTSSAEQGEHFTRAVVLTEMPTTVNGLEPVSGLADEWVPDESDPARSFAEIATPDDQRHPDPANRAGWRHQAGTGPVVSSRSRPTPAPAPAGPRSCTSAAAPNYPLAAVISFTPDPTVRERWNTALTAPPDS